MTYGPRCLTTAAMAALLSQVGCGGEPKKRDSVSIFVEEIQAGIEREPRRSEERESDREPKQFYAAPHGTATGDGSSARPWTLQYALSHPQQVEPGDIIWLRGGVYRGNFTSELAGRGAPIIVRQYPGERPILDGCADPPANKATLTVRGEYTWFWGIEVTNCHEVRAVKTAGSSPAELGRGTGVDVFGTDIKLIGMIIHDTAQGVGAWVPAKRLEVANSYIYYNGWDGPDRGHGHGIYIQNDQGAKKIYGNVIFHQFGGGIHAYGEAAPVKFLNIERNVSFMNGALSRTTGLSRNLILASSKGVSDTTLAGNLLYYPLSAKGGRNDLGYGGPCAKTRLTDNYFAGPEPLTAGKCEQMSASGNTFVGAAPKFWISEFPQNEYLDQPRGVNVSVRVNKWEPDRALITVLNWERRPRVEVDISSLEWEPGRKYRVRNVQDLFGEALRNAYEGEPIDLPMHGWKIADPVGVAPPPSTFPEFGVFVIEPDDYPETGTQVSVTQRR